MRYVVDYELDGQTKCVEYSECKDPGMAFAWCQEQFPGCEVLLATAQSRDPRFNAKTEYAPPPKQRDYQKPPGPSRAPKKNELDGVMPFYDEALSEKPWS